MLCHRSLHRLISAVGLVVFGAAVGCAGNARLPVTVTAPPIQPGDAERDVAPFAGGTESQLPDIAGVPFPYEPGLGTVAGRPNFGRGTSAESEVTLLGDEHFLAAADAVPVASKHQLFLDSDPQSICWGIYKFTGVGVDQGPFALGIELASPLPAQYYIGVADFDALAWQWTAVNWPTGADYTSIGERQLVSPTNALYVAVVAWDDCSTVLANLTLHLNVDAPPPLGLAASDGASPSTIQLSWMDPADSFPGLSYESVRLERAISPEGPFSMIALVPPGVTSYNDVHDGETNRLPYDEAVFYRASTVIGGAPGGASLVESGYRLLGDVKGFTASTDLPDRIELAWQPVTDAEMYGIEYRASGGGEPAEWTALTLTADVAYTHMEDNPPESYCAEKQLYEFRIWACYMGYLSVNCAVARGLHDGAPVAVLAAFPEVAYPGMPVTFDGSASYDSGGGSIVDFRFDLEGDGTYEVSGMGPQVAYTYDNFGDYHAAIDVLDDEGDIDTGAVQVRIPGWSHTYGSDGVQTAEAVAVDAQGNVYAAANWQAGSVQAIGLSKSSSQGQLLWMHFWRFGEQSASLVEAIGIDQQGNVYLAGSVEIDDDADALFFRVLPDGTLDWAKTWARYGVTAGDETISDLAVDGNGNLLMTGAFKQTSGVEWALAFRCSTDGTIAWVRHLDPTGQEAGSCVAISPDGWNRLYFGLKLRGQTEQGIGLMVLDEEGAILLQQGWYHPDYVALDGLAVDASGTAYLCGLIQAEGASSDALLLKMDFAGNLLWQKRWNSLPADQVGDSWTAMQLEGNRLHLVGLCANPTGIRDLDGLWVTLNSEGGVLNQVVWGGDANAEAFADLVPGAGGALYIAGHAYDNGGKWRSAAGELSELSGTTAQLTGMATTTSGEEAIPAYTELEVDLVVEDSGGGAKDTLVMQLGPLN